MSGRAIWIVEIKIGPLWQPTVEAALTRADAKRGLARMKVNCPDDRFRIRRYLPEAP